MQVFPHKIRDIGLTSVPSLWTWPLAAGENLSLSWSLVQCSHIVVYRSVFIYFHLFIFLFKFDFVMKFVDNLFTILWSVLFFLRLCLIIGLVSTMRMSTLYALSLNSSSVSKFSSEKKKIKGWSNSFHSGINVLCPELFLIRESLYTIRHLHHYITDNWFSIQGHAESSVHTVHGDILDLVKGWYYSWRLCCDQLSNTTHFFFINSLYWCNSTAIIRNWHRWRVQYNTHSIHLERMPTRKVCLIR